jgi:hypothetical protein
MREEAEKIAITFGIQRNFEGQSRGAVCGSDVLHQMQVCKAL